MGEFWQDDESYHRYYRLSVDLSHVANYLLRSLDVRRSMGEALATKALYREESAFDFGAILSDIERAQSKALLLRTEAAYEAHTVLHLVGSEIMSLSYKTESRRAQLNDYHEEVLRSFEWLYETCYTDLRKLSGKLFTEMYTANVELTHLPIGKRDQEIYEIIKKTSERGVLITGKEIIDALDINSVECSEDDFLSESDFRKYVVPILREQRGLSNNRPGYYIEGIYAPDA